MAEALKPVKLQINTTGAWRDVVKFDAGNDVQACEVMDAAATLGRVAKAKFRVVMDDGLQSALSHWTPELGAWKPFKSHWERGNG